MIDSLRIQNFRCFKELELHGLRRINVVVGPNAMGKTALLEAIKIGLAGVPTIITWVAQSRGVFLFVPPNPTREQFEGQCSDWFSDFNNSAPIVIWGRDSQGHEATLRIFYDLSKAVTTQSFMSGVPTPTLSTTIIPLAFERTHFSGESSTLYATINPQGQLHFEPGRELGLPCAFFWSAMLGAAHENASWFSKLSVSKRANEVIAALQKHFPYIQNLSTETPLSTNPPAIYADLKTLPQKLPVSLVSAGMNRLLSFILAVITFEKGVVLIDEVENGIFHDQFTRLWETLAGLARQHDTQLFVTTHSLECLKAAVPLMKEAPDDFCLLRADKKDMQSIIQMFAGAKIEAALNSGGEVR